MEAGHLLLAGVFLAALVFLSGCTQTSLNGQNQSQNQTQLAPYVLQCINSCNNTLQAGDSSALELGPCLLDPIPNEPDWVCDVAHSPRQEMDNNPHNQCQDYLTGKAHHFVEVSTECKLIRAV